MTSKATLIRRLNWADSKLSTKGRKIAAADANWKIRLEDGGWDSECYWSMVHPDDLRDPVERNVGVWNVQFPWGGTYHCPSRYVKRMTKMGLKAALRKMGR